MWVELLALLLWVLEQADKLFMNKIVASVGLAALGASALHTASAQNLDIPRSTAKPWSISATLRGFYDDNPTTAPSAYQHGSSGFEVSPAASLKWSAEQTTLGMSYLYSLKYYDNKPAGNADHYDQTHTFDLSLDHAFNEQYRLGLKDDFVIGQEPDMLSSGPSIATPYRIPGDNIRNSAAINLDGNVSREIGFSVGYDNAFYDYADDDDSNGRVTTAGILNRLEHGVHLDGKWLATPETTGVMGFRFRETDYTADQLISTDAPVYSDNRNNRLYSPNVGLDHTFLPNLSGSIRVGASYADYYNDASSSGGWSPYVLVSTRYVYAQDSYAEIGFTHDRGSTDVVGVNTANGSFTQDMELSTVFGTLHYSFDPRLSASLTGQYQHSTFNGGVNNDENDDYFLVGLNLQYRFTQNFSAEVGYNYDKLGSDISGRNYDRNRVYMGVTASY
jgi:Putative beta-barrel porin 2